jgi:hypothetical protein
MAEGFFVDPAFSDALRKAGLTTQDEVFSYTDVQPINPGPLPPHRSRVCFQLPGDGPTVYLKRYNYPPKVGQIVNWISHRRRAATADYDWLASEELDRAGVWTAQIIAYGAQWHRGFEKRSFVLIREITEAKPLEEELPLCFRKSNVGQSQRLRQRFVKNIADFIRRFHDTGYRHRDLYLSHVFYDRHGEFHLIDLQRVFKPLLFNKRFLIKDLAQLYFSCPAEYIFQTDRLRFYLRYRNQQKITDKDKIFINRLLRRVQRMARHDLKRGKRVPCLRESAFPRRKRIL